MEQKAFAFLPVPFAIAAIREEGFRNASGLLANTATPRHLEPSSQQIAHLARRIWEAEGRPEGREKAHWLEAEARLRALLGHVRTIRESTAW
jgi:DUF2934 family protein